MAPRATAPRQMGRPARRTQSAVAGPGLALTDGGHRWEKPGQEALGAHAPPRPARWRPEPPTVPERPENSGARPGAFSVGLSPCAWYVWPIAAPLNGPAGLLVRRRQFTQTPPRGGPSTVQAASADGRGLGIWRRRGTTECQRPLPAWAMRVGHILCPSGIEPHNVVECKGLTRRNWIRRRPHLDAGPGTGRGTVACPPILALRPARSSTGYLVLLPAVAPASCGKDRPPGPAM